MALRFRHMQKGLFRKEKRKGGDVKTEEGTSVLLRVCVARSLERFRFVKPEQMVDILLLEALSSMFKISMI